MFHESVFRRSTFTPPGSAATAALPGLVSFRRSHGWFCAAECVTQREPGGKWLRLFSWHIRRRRLQGLLRWKSGSHEASQRVALSDFKRVADRIAEPGGGLYSSVG